MDFQSHITLHLSNFCREKQIIIVALYPKTIHLLQPLDVSVFGNNDRKHFAENGDMNITSKI